jgi:hypothetical protein
MIIQSETTKKSIRHYATRYAVLALYYHLVEEDQETAKVCLNASLTYLYPVSELILQTLN